MVMYNLDDFIKLCFDKNKRHFLKQDFESKELLDIVRKTLSDSSYKSKINNFIKVNRDNHSSKDIIYRNLRMTCVEGQL